MALVIFDLDGTLVDSVDGIAYSMNKVLSELGCDVHSVEKYKTFVGNGIKALVELAVPKEWTEEQVTFAFEKMLISYQENYDYQIRIYDGIYEMLDDLVERGHTLAMITNKHQSMADPIMSKYFGKYPFKSIVGRSDTNPKKPDPTTVYRTVERLNGGLPDTYFVGDTEVDLATAKNAGVNDIIVSWGFRETSIIEAIGATVIVEHPREILKYID